LIAVASFSIASSADLPPRLTTPDGKTAEWNSQALRAYQRWHRGPRAAFRRQQLIPNTVSDGTVR
jgi:hypothetical protein